MPSDALEYWPSGRVPWCCARRCSRCARVAWGIRIHARLASSASRPRRHGLAVAAGRVGNIPPTRGCGLSAASPCPGYLGHPRGGRCCRAVSMDRCPLALPGETPYARQPAPTSASPGAPVRGHHRGTGRVVDAAGPLNIAIGAARTCSWRMRCYATNSPSSTTFGYPCYPAKSPSQAPLRVPPSLLPVAILGAVQERGGVAGRDGHGGV
jgi:hypothetical protein